MSCVFPDCPNPGRRRGYCWGHVKQRQRHGVMRELQEPRGAARDRAGLPRRPPVEWVRDAVQAVADADSVGDRGGYERAEARLRMAIRRRERAHSELRPRKAGR